MELKIGYGIGDIVFGMKREDIISLLGESDVKRKLDEFPDDPAEEWDYNDQMLTLQFCDTENGRLESIESENKDISVFSEPIIGMDEKGVVELMKANGYGDYECDNYYSCKILGYKYNFIDFEITYGEVKRIKLGVLFDDNDNHIWQYNQ